MTAPDLDQRLTKAETTLWGAHGSNGINGDVKRHREQIGELFGRDEAMRKDFTDRMDALEDRLRSRLDGLYKLMATLIVTILVGAGGIIATLVVTAQ